MDNNVINDNKDGGAPINNSASSRTPAECRALAEMLFPNWGELPTIAQLDERFPPRALPEGAMVNRVGPSPTGMMHIGGLYVSLINRRLARQTGGVFFLRVEDTDTKRTVEGAFETIVDSLNEYQLLPDEGAVRNKDGSITEIGHYGPYVQSARKEIYHGCAFEMICRGAMYPCFMTEEELTKQREAQIAQEVRTGVYGQWAKSRNLSLDEIAEQLKNNTPYVLRLRAAGGNEQTISWDDGVRGNLTLPAYDVDTVLIKRDGIPTYHFAHLVDDHYMRTTHIIRAEEWISSVPLHLQLFNVMGWTPPKYAHISAIQKMSETGGKRKLSKRTDAEAYVQFYWEHGFPREAVIEYLLNLANSEFEDWRRANLTLPYTDFQVSLEKMSIAGPLADLVKMENISRDILDRIDIDRFYECAQLWTAKFDPELATEIAKDPSYTRRALDVERGSAKAAKRIITLKDLREQLGPFFDKFLTPAEALPFPENISLEDRNSILNTIKERFDETSAPTEFFEKLKAIAGELGFASNVKDYKKNPQQYKGHVGDVATVVRVAMFGSLKSPDLGTIMHVMGKTRVVARCERAITSSINAQS